MIWSEPLCKTTIWEAQGFRAEVDCMGLPLGGRFRGCRGEVEPPWDYSGGRLKGGCRVWELKGLRCGLRIGR